METLQIFAVVECINHWYNTQWESLLEYKEKAQTIETIYNMDESQNAKLNEIYESIPVIQSKWHESDDP